MSIFFFYAGVLAFVLLLIFGALSTLVRRHPLSIPIVWYTFALGFCLTIVAHYVIAALNLDKIDPAAYELIVWLVHISMDIEGEFKLLAIVFFVAVAPQIMGYFLSGISGVAERPVFVSQFTSIVTWFMVKASAFLAGIQLQFAIFIADNPFQPLQMERGGFLIATAISLLMAFTIVVMRHDLDDILHAIVIRAPVLQRAHRWLQRNLRKPSQH